MQLWIILSNGGERDVSIKEKLIVCFYLHFEILKYHKLEDT